MNYKVMEECDIEKVIPLYIEHYNQYEDGAWTEETTRKRIHQVWSREDSLCVLAEDKGQVAGFAMGNFEQYDDLSAYDLIEIVVAHDLQNRGIGAEFMLELERMVKEKGGAMIQLEAVNDAMHEAFYGKLHYKNAENLVLKSKWL